MAKGRHSTKETAALARMAALKFEPWQHEEGEWTPPTKEEWVGRADRHLVTLHLGWGCMFQTKLELVSMMDELDAEGRGSEVLNSFVEATTFFRNILSILEAANVRVLSAASVAAIRDGGA